MIICYPVLVILALAVLAVMLSKEDQIE